MLKNRTGMHADAYDARFLLKPLGIEKMFWFKNEEGHPHTGGGLCLTARDAARFGLLYLQNGGWGDEQIVSEEWGRESVRKHVDLTIEGQPPSGYGYLWWILAPDPQGNGQQISTRREDAAANLSSLFRSTTWWGASWSTPKPEPIRTGS